jgi:branched-subunit amino acid ABC-type transport system permease component
MVSLSPTMGSQIIIETFAVVVIGGLGSLPGSLIGALIVGEFEAFGILIAPEIALPLLYLLMAVILVIRPTGLLGTSDR